MKRLFIILMLAATAFSYDSTWAHAKFELSAAVPEWFFRQHDTLVTWNYPVHEFDSVWYVKKHVNSISSCFVSDTYTQITINICDSMEFSQRLFDESISYDEDDYGFHYRSMVKLYFLRTDFQMDKVWYWFRTVRKPLESSRTDTIPWYNYGWSWDNNIYVQGLRIVNNDDDTLLYRVPIGCRICDHLLVKGFVMNIDSVGDLVFVYNRYNDFQKFDGWENRLTILPKREDIVSTSMPQTLAPYRFQNIFHEFDALGRLVREKRQWQIVFKKAH